MLCISRIICSWWGKSLNKYVSIENRYGEANQWQFCQLTQKIEYGRETWYT